MKKKQYKKTITQELYDLGMELTRIGLILNKRSTPPRYKGGPRITQKDLTTLKRRTTRIRNILGIPEEG